MTSHPNDEAVGLAEPPADGQAATPGRPTLRWTSRARTIDEVERELSRIWAIPELDVDVGGERERRIAARTSVMNLVVIARRPELGERAAAIIAGLTGRHPSRTIVVSSVDPDGPSWLDARIQAFCVLPREDAPEICAESVTLQAGGESGGHLAAIVAPLLVHDLPVTLWWLGEPPLGRREAAEVIALADRLVVDGSTWSGDGLARLGQLSALAARGRPSVFDFALVRQARWREAIASVFDRPEFLPYLRSLRRVAVTYASTAPNRAGSTNMVKPLYHVAWLASRLDLSVVEPLAPARGAGGRPLLAERGLAATLGRDGHEVNVVIRPVASPMPPGTTLRVELLAERRGSELRADVTAEAELVHARVWEDGVESLDRSYRAPRLGETDLLMEAIESPGVDRVTAGAIAAIGPLLGREPAVASAPTTGHAAAAARRFEAAGAGG
ncbi:MAG TPA: glucose-6-phosphate dehydrogenase assembly protein OpcA [Candidatus Dormibacteraeota bacterium]|nr:glucose-6-phosphate dehydrogenase assembly protein OpcA [Candidatus Dormibacteraeota bacterium]